MWTSENRGRYERSTLQHPSGLTDDACTEAGRILPSPPKTRHGLAEPQPPSARVLAPRLNPTRAQ